MATQETKEKGHSSFGEKVKGAAHVVHGIGENIRGSMLGAAESLGGSEEGKAKDDDIVAKGRSEMQQGIAQMKGEAVHGGTSAVEAKTGDQPPAKQEAAGPIQAPPSPSPEPQIKIGDQPQPEKEEVPGPTQAPPPQDLVHIDDPQTRQAVLETSQQELIGGIGTKENVKPSSEKTQAISGGEDGG